MRNNEAGVLIDIEGERGALDQRAHKRRRNFTRPGGDRERFDEMNREGARAALPALNVKRE